MNIKMQKVAMCVLGVERLDKILSMLDENKTLTVDAIASALFISEATARRDLIRLENKGLVRRVHGGVMHADSSRDIPITLRENETPDQKSIVAAKAAALVRMGDTLMIDASTTCQSIVRYLPDNSNLLVVTSGLKAAVELADRHIHTMVTGGTIMDNSYSLAGHYANQIVNDLVVNIAFLSCRGIGADGRICGAMEDEMQLRRAMAQHAKRVVILVTANKIGKEYCYTFGSIEDVDDILCDSELPPGWQMRIGANRRKRMATQQDFVHNF